jgi:hypothetical protein
MSLPLTVKKTITIDWWSYRTRRLPYFAHKIVLGNSGPTDDSAELASSLRHFSPAFCLCHPNATVLSPHIVACHARGFIGRRTPEAPQLH